MFAEPTGRENAEEEEEEEEDEDEDEEEGGGGEGKGDESDRREGNLIRREEIQSR